MIPLYYFFLCTNLQSFNSNKNKKIIAVTDFISIQTGLSWWTRSNDKEQRLGWRAFGGKKNWLNPNWIRQKIRELFQTVYVDIGIAQIDQWE